MEYSVAGDDIYLPEYLHHARVKISDADSDKGAWVPSLNGRIAETAKAIGKDNDIEAQHERIGSKLNTVNFMLHPLDVWTYSQHISSGGHTSSCNEDKS